MRTNHGFWYPDWFMTACFSCGTFCTYTHTCKRIYIVRSYVRTYIRACTHTCIQTNIHTQAWLHVMHYDAIKACFSPWTLYIYTCAYLRAYIHTFIRTYVRTYRLPWRTQIHIYIHAYDGFWCRQGLLFSLNARKHTYIHACMHYYVHVLRACMHTCILSVHSSLSLSFSLSLYTPDRPPGKKAASVIS